MQAVIPIAGRGKRMAQRSQGPKQLLPVAGRPVVEHALAALPPEIDELVLVVGGPHEQRIREYFGSEHGGRRVTTVRQTGSRGLGDAVQQAAPVVRDRFLVMLPDDIYSARDFRAMLEEDLAALAMRVAHPESFGVLLRDKEGYLQGASEKPKEFVSDLVSTGAYVLDPGFFEMRGSESARGEVELPDLVITMVRTRERRVKVLEASFWLPVNDPAQLTFAEQELLKLSEQAREAILRQVPES